MPGAFQLALAFLLAAVLTAAMRRIAPHLGAVAAPKTDRWHRNPTPLLGGVAITLALAITLAFNRGLPPAAAPILLAAGLLFAVGTFDDFRPIKAHIKLVAEIAAAALLLAWHLVLPWTHFNAVNELITLFWLVGITNAFNLLDNMDGLAAGVAVIASLFQAGDLLLNGQPAAAALPLLVACTVAGFLVFNFPPASIFMGDSGSLVIGFLLAGSCLLSDWQRSRGLAAVLVAPVLIMLVPIADTTLVSFTRKFHGRAISQGGRDHSSHRLVAMGLSERSAVLFLYGLCLLCGGVALVLRLLGDSATFFVAPGLAIALVIVLLQLGAVRVYPEGDVPVKTTLTALVGFSYKRRVFEVLFDVVLIVLAYYGAFLLRYGALIPGAELDIFHRFLPLVIALEAAAFLAGGLYRGLWHYIGIEDLATMARCIVAAALATALAILLLQHGPRLSLSVLTLNGILLLLLVAGSRISLRLLRSSMAAHVQHRPGARTPVLIYGAGVRGELVARDLLSTPQYLPVGFIEDDDSKVGRRLHGVNIYAARDLEKLRRKHGVGEIFVSSPLIPEVRVRALGLKAYNAKTSTELSATAGRTN